MKIAMIGQKGIPARSGGIERHVEELSAELARHGHDVLVFCRSWYVNRTLETHRGVRLLFTPSIRTKHLDAITHTFFSIIKATREEVDVYHFHGVGPALLCWLPKLLSPGAKVIVTFHCIDRHHQKWNPFARFMLHLGERLSCHVPDATIAVSKTLQAYCRLSYGKDALYIPNGAHVAMAPADTTLLQAFNLQPGSYLMMCARLVRHKGAHKLIEAWKKLRVDHPDLTQGKKLVIVGGGAFTDAYVAEVTKAAEGDTSIVLTGVQTGDTLHALFAHAFAVVHPSESEGLPIAVLEAMGYGKCVLSSDIPENLELTQQHGMSFKTGDVRDLEEKMRWLFEHPDLVQAVGREAREHIANHFDWEEIGHMTSSLYEVMQAEPKWKIA